jgi:DNA-binding NarL/FixJ family response regulator
MRFLIVDPGDVAPTVSALRPHEVLVERDLAGAKARLRLPVAGVIVEPALPRGDGLDVLVHLWKRDQATPVLAATAHFCARDGSRAFRLGVPYVPKDGALRLCLAKFVRQVERARAVGPSAGEAAWQVAEALARDEAVRLTIALRVGGRKVNEIARELGEPEETIRTRLRRANAKAVRIYGVRLGALALRFAALGGGDEVRS